MPSIAVLMPATSSDNALYCSSVANVALTQSLLWLNSVLTKVRNEAISSANSLSLACNWPIWEFIADNSVSNSIFIASNLAIAVAISESILVSKDSFSSAIF